MINGDSNALICDLRFFVILLFLDIVAKFSWCRKAGRLLISL